ncbi:MAG: hypothetical protein MJ211_15825, partial [Bacteroidales bacterium]|nr:hypothetical protein [Bacteroidales bacterium]
MKKILLILIFINILKLSFGQFYNFNVELPWPEHQDNIDQIRFVTCYSLKYIHNPTQITYSELLSSGDFPIKIDMLVYHKQDVSFSSPENTGGTITKKNVEDYLVDEHTLIYKHEFISGTFAYYPPISTPNELYRWYTYVYFQKFHFTFSNYIKKQENRDYLCQEDYVSINYSFPIPVETTLWYSIDQKNWTEFKIIEANQNGTTINYSEVKDKGLISTNFYIKLTYTTEDGTSVTEYPKKGINNEDQSTNFISFYPNVSINTDNLIVNNDTLSLPLTVNQTASIRDYFSENTPETISNNHKLLGGHSYEVYIKEDNKCPITKYVYLPEIEYKTINYSTNHFWYEDEVSNALNIIYNYPEILKDKTNPYSHSSDNRATFSVASRSSLGQITIKSPYNSSERITKNGIKETFSVVTNKNLTKITIEPKSSEFSDFIPINITDIKLEAYKKISWTIKPTIT